MNYFNTHRSLILTAVISLILGAAISAAFAHHDGEWHEGWADRGHMMHDDKEMGEGTGMQQDMTTTTDDLTGKTGDAFDQAFLSDMIIHHQAAVKMAQAALQSAKHQEIKDLAQKIITAQTTEINQMMTWQRAWYGQ